MIDAKIDVVIAIVCLTVLETVALLQGVDGSILSLVIAAISGLCGYEIKSMKR